MKEDILAHNIANAGDRRHGWLHEKLDIYTQNHTDKLSSILLVFISKVFIQCFIYISTISE